jgi:glycosyltransferase involved in cell wall biosynthesis
MKILYFSYLYDLWGCSLGSTLKAIELFGALQKLGHEIRMCWMNPGVQESQPGDGSNLWRKVRGRLKARFARFVHEPGQILANFRYLPRELREVNSFAPDLIIWRHDVYLFTELYTSRVVKLPWLLEGDGPSVREYRQFYRRYVRYGHLDSLIERAVVRKAPAIFVQSNETKRYFAEQGAPEEKLRMIPNGVDPAKFNPQVSGQEVRRKLGLDETAVVLGFSGSLHYWHGIDNLMRLMTQVCRSFGQAHFVIAGGGGPESDRLLAFVEEARLGQRVHFLGFVPHDQMPPVIAAFDIALAPYPPIERFHFSPVKIFEYMACGKPVVAARLGQIAEVIQDGQNGFLFEAGDFEGLLEKVRALIADPTLRRRLGEQAHRTVVPGYTWETQARKLEALCFEVLERFQR